MPPITAEDAASDEVLKKAREAAESGDPNPVDLAVIEALELQRREGISKRLFAKWEAIANIVEHTDKKTGSQGILFTRVPLCNCIL